jgi:hypothetical protein
MAAALAAEDSMLAQFRAKAAAAQGDIQAQVATQK